MHIGVDFKGKMHIEGVDFKGKMRIEGFDFKGKTNWPVTFKL